jgi:hypothetical protein
MCKVVDVGSWHYPESPIKAGYPAVIARVKRTLGNLRRHGATGRHQVYRDEARWSPGFWIATGRPTVSQ